MSTFVADTNDLIKALNLKQAVGEYSIEKVVLSAGPGLSAARLVVTLLPNKDDIERLGRELKRFTLVEVEG